MTSIVDEAHKLETIAAGFNQLHPEQLEHQTPEYDRALGIFNDLYKEADHFFSENPNSAVYLKQQLEDDRKAAPYIPRIDINGCSFGVKPTEASSAYFGRGLSNIKC